MPIRFPLARALEEGVQLVLVVVDEVKQARSRTSDGGRKITGPEWRVICARAGTQIMVGLTQVFAPFLDDDAIASFSDGDDPRTDAA